MLDPIACADTLVSERGMISFSRGGGELSFGWAAKLHNIECKKKEKSVVIQCLPHVGRCGQRFRVDHLGGCEARTEGQMMI